MCGWKIAAVLGFAGCMVQTEASCTAQTGAEAMVALRTAKGCPNPTTVPTGCQCTPNTEPNVTCNASDKALWSANWTSAASDCIKVTPDMAMDWSKHDFHYPSNYADTCNQAGMEPGSFHCTWVTGREANHTFAIGENYNSNWNSEAWCTDKFCWVDPCTCDKTDIAASTWLNGYYSYSVCGATDSYTPATCTGTTQSACVAISGCKWVDPGANSGGNTGGNTGGNSGGNSGANTGGNTGGNSGGNTGANTGGNNGGNSGDGDGDGGNAGDGSGNATTTASGNTATASDASGVKIGCTMALLLLYLAK